MTLQFSTALRNNLLDGMEATVGASAVLKVFTGSVPANCAAADSGTVLATVSLPSDWMAAASAGSKAKSGTWQDASADNTGTAGYYRIYDSGVTTCHLQGTVTITGGGGDMTVDSVSFTAGQTFTVVNYSWTAPGA